MGARFHSSNYAKSIYRALRSAQVRVLCTLTAPLHKTRLRQLLRLCVGQSQDVAPARTATMQLR